jgi:hypothetical protein
VSSIPGNDVAELPRTTVDYERLQGTEFSTACPNASFMEHKWSTTTANEVTLNNVSDSYLHFGTGGTPLPLCAFARSSPPARGAPDVVPWLLVPRPLRTAEFFRTGRVNIITCCCGEAAMFRRLTSGRTSRYNQHLQPCPISPCPSKSFQAGNGQPLTVGANVRKSGGRSGQSGVSRGGASGPPTRHVLEVHTATRRIA